jgi:hypothetical protein
LLCSDADELVRLLNPIPPPRPVTAESLKRKLEEEADEYSNAAKKAKTVHEVVGNVVILEDSDEEIVCLD